MPNTKRHILIFIDWYLPGYKAGGPIRSVFNMIEALKHIYQFSIITGNTDLGSDKPYHGIPSNVWTQTPQGHRVMYLSQEAQTLKNIRTLIREVKPDVIHINGMFSLHFSIIPLFVARYLRKTPVVLSVRGMLHSSALSVKQNKKLLFLAFSRGLGLYRNVTLHATNEDEQREIEQNLGGKFDVKIAQNFPGRPPEFDSLPEKDKQPGVLNLVWVARISPEKNALLLLDILSYSKLPLTIHIYGSAINADYDEQFKETLKALPHTITATLKGHITPEEVPQALADAHVFILPTKGENFGHAIFEALSHGVPVIISDNTPWRNLEVHRAGFDLPADVEAFAGALHHFHAMDNETFNRWRKGAYDVALAHVRDMETIEAYKNIFG